MRKLLSLALLLTILALLEPAGGQDPQPFEMATYYVAFLKPGPAWTPQETEETRRIQDGHMANIKKMAAEGKLVLAGPFSDETDLRGMFVFTVNSIEEAKALCDRDPAIRSGRLVAELHPWYSAKGITIVQSAKKN